MSYLRLMPSGMTVTRTRSAEAARLWAVYTFAHYRCRMDWYGRPEVDHCWRCAWIRRLFRVSYYQSRLFSLLPILTSYLKRAPRKGQLSTCRRHARSRRRPRCQGTDVIGGAQPLCEPKYHWGPRQPRPESHRVARIHGMGPKPQRRE